MKVVYIPDTNHLITKKTAFMKTNKIIGLLAFFFMIAFTACDDDNDNDLDMPEMGSFSLSISGDMDYQTEGMAYFGHYYDPEFGEDIFIVSLAEGIETTFNMFFIKSGDQPATGQHAVVSFDFEEDGDLPSDAFVSSITIQFDNNDAPEIYFLQAEAGSINIQESSNNRVNGSFEYDGTGFHTMVPEEELEISVSGEFDAIFADPGDPAL